MAEAAPSIEELGAVLAELAGAYTIGGLTRASGISGGGELQTQTIEALAGMTSKLGLDLIPAFVQPESGWVAVASRFLTASRDWLTSAARGTVVALSKNPALTIGAGLIGGALYTTYQWLTADERIELERIRQAAQVQRHAFDGMNKEDRARAFQQISGSLLPPTRLANLLTWALIGGAGYLVYRELR